MKRAAYLFCFLWLAFSSFPACAHRPSDAFVTLTLDNERLTGQWEIALRDLEAAAGMDANGDGAVTWGELRDAQPALDQLLISSLDLSADGNPCPLRIGDVLINDRLDGRYAWFPLSGACDKTPPRLTVGYRLLLDIDPTHRGILVIHAGSVTQTAVFSPDQVQLSLSLEAPSRWRQFVDYLREGVHHIWIGVDHILFLVTLLLPSVLLRSGQGWQAVPRARGVAIDVLGVVTAFTAAHSITLALAAMDVLRLPTAPVETAIAFSVLLAALNNVFPVVTGRRWLMAFGFGLIHGFGFASALSELGLPDDARAISLIAFNAGVELGQLAIVAALLPMIYWMRQQRLYASIAMRGGSILICAVSIVWIAQRSGIFGY